MTFVIIAYFFMNNISPLAKKKPETTKINVGTSTNGPITQRMPVMDSIPKKTIAGRFFCVKTPYSLKD